MLTMWQFVHRLCAEACVVGVKKVRWVLIVSEYI